MHLINYTESATVILTLTYVVAVTILNNQKILAGARFDLKSY